MGNQQFKISDIDNAVDRNDLEERVKEIHANQEMLKNKQQLLTKSIENKGESDIFVEKVTIIKYIQCLHMGSLRRNLFHKHECEDSMNKLVISFFDKLENISQIDRAAEIAAKISKLE
uniref:Uncharacterized protein n=1 Tax=Pithovirus LCPAC101 TaxID=2506586 RepID=A0A481Z3G0_9VIRU|nr:MAG: hypothetical protein LCPAC101_02790 [Pithovirus LCPAC101]